MAACAAARGPQSRRDASGAALDSRSYANSATGRDHVHRQKGRETDTPVSKDRGQCEKNSLTCNNERTLQSTTSESTSVERVSVLRLSTCSGAHFASPCLDVGRPEGAARRASRHSHTASRRSLPEM